MNPWEEEWGTAVQPTEQVQAQPWEESWDKPEAPQGQSVTSPWEENWETPSVETQDEVPPQQPALNRVDTLMQRYGRRLNQNDFYDKENPQDWKDPELGAIIEDNLAARAGGVGYLGEIAIGTAGGATFGDWQKMTAEDKFETWQNYQRSFAGGQTVTTANELYVAQTADDATKMRLGEGYTLFENMDNIFTGEGTWGDTFDGVRDYMSAAIWDPTTVASLGVGRLFTAGGSRAAAKGIQFAGKTAYQAELKKQLTKGVARNVAIAAANKVQAEAQKKAIEQLAIQGSKYIAPSAAKRLAAYGAVDVAVNVGTDLAYQNVLLDTGAQDAYSPLQTGVAALGAIAIPALVEGGKLVTKGLSKASAGSKLEKIFAAYDEIKLSSVSKSAQEIESMVKNRVDLSKVSDDLAKSFSNFKDTLPEYTKWIDAKVEAGKILDKEGVEVASGDLEELFFRSFLFGSTEGSQKGLIESLQDAGLVYVPRGPDDKVTNWVGDVIKWLPDEVVEKAAKDFEEATGSVSTIRTAEGLSAYWKKQQSLAGKLLQQSSYAKRVLSSKPNLGDVASDLLDGRGEIQPDVGPERLHYLQTVWKRMLTSHPGTTGLNVKGWAQTSLLNSVSDFVLGGLNYSQALMTRDVAQAAYLRQKGKGSILGAMRRGYNFLDFDATMDTAWSYLNVQPEVANKLFKELSGDVGATNVLERFNLDPTSKINVATEKTVETIQQLSGVVLQDEVTKTISFMSNLDQAIMREYGMTFNEFMQKPDLLVEMASERYQTMVNAKALDRTLRETFAKSWSEKPGNFVTLRAAKFMESLSNGPVTGYAIPFGRFFNTSMAMMGDYSMVNFGLHFVKKAQGKAINVAEEEGAELFAKGIVGISGLVLLGVNARDKVATGLAWNQERREDGSIKDTTYDFPESAFRIAAQVIGHKLYDGEVPATLKEEAVMALGGQTFRSGDEGLKAAFEFAKSIIGMDGEAVADNLMAVTGSFVSNIFSGITRPLDPVNQAAMMISGDYSQVDRRQGYKVLNDSFRYIDKLDNLLGLTDEDGKLRAYPTRGTEQFQDLGRILGGNRSTPEPTLADRLFNSVGIRDWQAVRWDGDAAVKNRLDELIAPVLNSEAEFLLRKNPDFFEMPLEKRQFLVTEVVKKSKKRAKELLKSGGTLEDKSLAILEKIASKPKAQLQKVMDKLGLEEGLEDLAAKPEGYRSLETILYMMENYEEFFLK